MGLGQVDVSFRLIYSELLANDLSRNRPYVLEALWRLGGLRAEWQRDFSATHRG